MVDDQLGAGAVAGRDHLIGLFQVEGHRFFAEDAACAGFGCGDRHRPLEIVHRADADDIDVGLRQHLLIAAVALRDRPAFAEEVELVGVDIGGGHQLRTGDIGVRLRVQRGHPAAADDAYRVTLVVAHLGSPAGAAPA